MPNQSINTIQKDTSTIYSDMDEILTKPPAGIVRYGSATLFILLLILCSISFFVKYNEGISGAAYIKADINSVIKSPQFDGVIVEKNFIQRDTILQKGDTILILKNQSSTNRKNTVLISLLDNEGVIAAPFTGKITCQRKLQNGNQLDANTLLFEMVAGQNEFKIKINVEDADVNKIMLGQNVKLTAPGYPQNIFYIYTCEIISLPYTDDASHKTTVDAILKFKESDNKENELRYILATTVNAYIITEQKSLAAAFAGL